jgi:molybdopterin molybdotransferase
MNRPDIRRLPKRANPQEAVDKLLASVSANVVPTEAVPLEQCVGRVLAKDVFSDLNIPDYDKTFLDGYAPNTKETHGATPAKPPPSKS